MKLSHYLRFLRRGLRHAGPPLHLTVFVTGRCNLRCRHCFHWREVDAGVPGPALADLERLAASLPGPLLWLSLGGGEPFLRQDLADVAAAFARRGLSHLAIPTNGLIDRQHALAAEILERCPETYLSIGVSIDGPAPVHDAIRQAPGSHARSLEAVRAFQRQAAASDRLGVGLIVTVARENQDGLAEHVRELVTELRPDNVTVNLARGTALDESLLAVDTERYREVVEAKRELVRSGQLPYFDFPFARLALARDELMYEHVARVADAGGHEGADLGSDHLPCTAGRLSAVVFEDGSVHPCEILGESIGNLNDVDWDLARLWDAARAHELRERIKSSRCRCTWECAQADNVLFNARAWPRLARKALTR